MVQTNLEYCTDGKRHLICRPYSIRNLHIMASDLGIKFCWFHRNHYDIPKKRIKEIEAKCTIVSSKDIIDIMNGPHAPNPEWNTTGYEHLLPYGYAPGKYMIAKCFVCDQMFQGVDKRASTCYDCASFEYEHDKLIKGE